MLPDSLISTEIIHLDQKHEFQSLTRTPIDDHFHELRAGFASDHFRPLLQIAGEHFEANVPIWTRSGATTKSLTFLQMGWKEGNGVADDDHDQLS